MGVKTEWEKQWDELPFLYYAENHSGAYGIFDILGEFYFAQWGVRSREWEVNRNHIAKEKALSLIARHSNNKLMVAGNQEIYEKAMRLIGTSKKRDIGCGFDFNKELENLGG